MTVINATDSGERQSTIDAQFMAHALRLGDRGRYDCQPNPHVGCVIVKDGKVIAEGLTSPAGGPHAEISALNSASTKTRGATVYVTLEPCCYRGKTGPCTAALIKAQPARVVIAILDVNPQVSGKGAQALKQAGIEVHVGTGESAALHANRAFFHRIRTNTPFVRLKVAMSLDGNTAMPSGESRWITSLNARLDVHRLRLAAGAVLTGIGTVLEDDPQMTARLEEAKRQPLRVVLDSHSRMPNKAKLLGETGRSLIYQSKPNQILATEEIEVAVASLAEDNRIDLPAVLDDLANREINHLLVEAGATLSGAFIKQDLVDELIVYMAPDILGADARGAFMLPGLANLTDKHSFEIIDSRLVGRDLRLTLARTPA